MGRRWRALEDLRWVNRWLGGYTSVQHALRLLLTPHRNDQRPLRLVDLGTSAMFAHDGPLSVRRGWRRSELRALAGRAGLPVAHIRWRWAFRWVLSTVVTPVAHASSSAFFGKS